MNKNYKKLERENERLKKENEEKSGFYILFPLQVFLIPFIIILLIVASYRDDYNAKLRESKKGDFKVSLESYSPEVQAILKKSFEESKDK